MTNQEKAEYAGPEQLLSILQRELYGKKFKLPCGHHITFGETLANDLIIFNGKKMTFTCLDCGR